MGRQTDVGAPKKRGARQTSALLVVAMTAHERLQPLSDARERARTRGHVVGHSGVGMRIDVVVMQALGRQHQGLRIASAQGHGITEHDISPGRAASVRRERFIGVSKASKDNATTRECTRTTGQPERQT